ncbi:hypothetical protein PVT67_06000 [Gallaecimonas kandeliae]|uniref:hypothetical protein n=1 Tax=Gallaecimonas kandeliae TaxID=3029055 RepID=UPI00264A31A0|nr:hypothetical protein [Gallaecimonas kandeliae]WKE66790.1 hypothetical protein PVT67_06000 [Gallaecimonas kandeliae]
MRYEEFFYFAYANIESIAFISLVIFAFLFLSLRRFSLSGFLDPFHIIYTFTYSTSYAVVLALWSGGFVDGIYMLLVMLYGVLFWFVIFSLSRLNVSVGRISLYVERAIDVRSTGAGKVVAFIYVFLTAIVLFSKGFSLFTVTNRFEDNRGLGPLVKFWSYSSLFIVAYLSIKLHLIKKRYRKRALGLVIVCLVILDSAIGGAKSDLIFYGLACVFSVSIFSGRIQVKAKSFILIFIVGIISIFTVLYFNMRSSIGSGGFESVLSFLSVKFMDRILSNGDMYYMGLPNDVIDKVTLNNVLVVFFSPVLSLSVVSKLAGQDLSVFELGRQVLLYHYPDYNIAGGPTDHFDLFAYKYFGFLAPLFIAFLAFYIYVVRTVVSSSYNNHYMSSFYTVIWFSVMDVILKPGTLISSIFFPFLFFALINALCFCFKRVSMRSEYAQVQ